MPLYDSRLMRDWDANLDRHFKAFKKATSGDGPRKSRPKSGALRCGGLVGAQRATLSKTIRGQWTVWKKGTAVWARESAPGEYFIRRVRQLGDGNLSCQNEMAFVPLSALRFQRPNNKI